MDYFVHKFIHSDFFQRLLAKDASRRATMFAALRKLFLSTAEEKATECKEARIAALIGLTIIGTPVALYMGLKAKKKILASEELSGIEMANFAIQHSLFFLIIAAIAIAFSAFEHR